MLMILPKKINERFYKALKGKHKEYGRGFNKFLCGETGYSTGYMSQVLNGNQAASQEAQIKISDASGMDYQSFLRESSTPEPKPTTRENEKPQQEAISLIEALAIYKKTNQLLQEKVESLEKEIVTLKERSAKSQALGETRNGTGI